MSAAATSRHTPTEAINELLLSAARCVVQFDTVADEFECVAELSMEPLRVIPRNREVTAFLGAVGVKRSHDGEAVWLERLQHLLDVAPTLVRLGQEAEHGAVVPNVIAFDCSSPSRMSCARQATLVENAPSRS